MFSPACLRSLFELLHGLFNLKTLNFWFQKFYYFQRFLFNIRVDYKSKPEFVYMRIDGFVPLFEKSLGFYKLFNFRDKKTLLKPKTRMRTSHITFFFFKIIFLFELKMIHTIHSTKALLFHVINAQYNVGYGRII